MVAYAELVDNLHPAATSSETESQFSVDFPVSSHLRRLNLF